ncbi:carboxymuconolactone decarboxylase family protein [Kitasatospora sp. NBC_01560]|uniref:carboxymuconolactone decarboxylase family protein n=1 Tax=Kitasatospora sp. NBC_01560 TaxID=2975965 RepID=UPI00386B184A
MAARTDQEIRTPPRTTPAGQPRRRHPRDDARDPERAKAAREGGVPETRPLRAGRIDDCSYCVVGGVASAKRNGESDERLHAVAAWREAPYLTGPECPTWTPSATCAPPSARVVESHGRLGATGSGRIDAASPPRWPPLPPGVGPAACRDVGHGGAGRRRCLGGRPGPAR